MRTTIFTFGLLLGLSVSAQTPLGQTRNWIINKNSDCYIHSNTSERLVTECDGGTYRIYYFDENGLCELFCSEFTKNLLGPIISNLKSNGATFLRYDHRQMLTSSYGDAPIRDCEVYLHDNLLLYVFKNDLTGFEYNKASIISTIQPDN